ncbi:MAG: sigma-70 family RNA polymerase sigma factor [Faecousia sp.]
MRLETQALAASYRDRLFAAAFQVCGNAADAEDAAQEALLRYHTSEKQFESEQHIRAWLLRVAINSAKNVSRSFWRRNTVPLEDYMETLEFDSGESRKIFREVMALPEKYRLVIHLFYYEDYSVEEISGILGITQGNVKTRLSRGRQLLKKSLQEVWDDE